MEIHLICIGNELLSERVNTHVNYIGKNLKKLGLRLSNAFTVGDDKKKIKTVFLASFNSADLIILTGGLGPTFDDLTRESIAEALCEELIFDTSVMDRINEHFARFGIPTPKHNERQAYVFKDSLIIDNEVGTAPGMIFKRDNKTIILLPGPPSELYPMFEKVVIDYLKNNFKTSFPTITKTFHTYGLPESKVHETIFDFVTANKDPDIVFSILPHNYTVDLKFEIRNKPIDESERVISELRLKFHELLGNAIYAEDDEDIEDVVGRLLSEKNKTVSVAESCTGGLVMDKLTNVSGSSRYFLHGVVAYSNESKINLLGVNPDTIRNYGAVSEQTAIEMAYGIKRVSGSDFALSITGIAGPTGATPGKPVGLVYTCLVGEGVEMVDKKIFFGNRRRIKEIAAFHALDMLRRQLLK